MKKYKVSTKNKKFNGVRYGVKFENGVAELELTDDVVKSLEGCGFTVEENKPAPKKAPQKKQTNKK